MNLARIIAMAAVLMVGCKSKPKKSEVPADQFFPITAYLKGEVARLDTSSASFFLVETVNDVSDTTPIKNVDVRRYAADFLTLPDITTADVRPDYTVDHLYEDLLDGFAFVYTTKENHPIQREDVVLQSDPKDATKNTVRSIFVVKHEGEGNAALLKKMSWEAGQGFQITTESTGSTAPAKRTRVYWNGFDSTSIR